jgi:hypothetical protein
MSLALLRGFLGTRMTKPPAGGKGVVVAEREMTGCSNPLALALAAARAARGRPA